MTPTLADRIDTLLPQTQCEQCGFHGCRPYAEAIAADEAGIDRCPPGGAIGIARLAALLDRPVVPLDPTHGVEKPRTLARIVEADCIGCTKCIQVCPVDAILGASKVMHTVVSDLCTGCELCVPACPVDCIRLDPMPLAQADDREHADAARRHFQRREARLSQERAERERQLEANKAVVAAPTARNAVLEALARARLRKKDTP
ncbi:MAG: RnfABCDGE type electron transport complex subunit B [Luteibacter sp.]|jgi:electron transport complex protein RnfB|uniref:RnfABCDGE type electron transport complex subunit B n=1 Tax=Rhodanobacteraceae TaxID=1775411 RepID=UPI000891C03E|nr:MULTISPECIES: RnfABCDGE type electron transport complex subunit B [Rhodanobacteraceae]MDQ7995491.1 RnfABCDGE type electron transport complex subunit B [Luteibacter sp.]MDQ8048900.1 RnfABCDGE type electron transport complex subunit B [Luteibacter sp.]SDG90434.1 electron transport complex protein RnfB [Dyella sp. 333MFSha]